MNIGTGKLLMSAPSMDDLQFRDATVFITEYNENGATGFVINKAFERPLNALAEFSSSPAFPLHDGGPVDREHLFFIHRRSDLISGGTWICDDIYLGGDFKQAVALINNKTLDESSVKVFIGYCGWDAEELETEIASGSWTVAADSPENIFAAVL